MTIFDPATTIRDALTVYADRFPDEGGTIGRIRTMLAETAGDVTQRGTVPAHVTASVIILQGAAMLTIWHPHLQAWLQPGGHIDFGEDPLTAALREALEETGLTCDLHAWHGTDACPYDIDLLPVPANARKGEPDHWHIDFRYLMVPRAGVAAIEPELPTACFRFGDIGSVSPSLARLGDKLQKDFHDRG